MHFGKIAGMRNGSEVICEVKAELGDGGGGGEAGKLHDLVAASEGKRE